MITRVKIALVGVAFLACLFGGNALGPAAAAAAQVHTATLQAFVHPAWPCVPPIPDCI